MSGRLRLGGCVKKPRVRLKTKGVMATNQKHFLDLSSVCKLFVCQLTFFSIKKSGSWCRPRFSPVVVNTLSSVVSSPPATASTVIYISVAPSPVWKRCCDGKLSVCMAGCGSRRPAVSSRREDRPSPGAPNHEREVGHFFSFLTVRFTSVVSAQRVSPRLAQRPLVSQNKRYMTLG